MFHLFLIDHVYPNKKTRPKVSFQRVPEPLHEKANAAKLHSCIRLHSQVVCGDLVETSEPYYRTYMRATCLH